MTALGTQAAEVTTRFAQGNANLLAVVSNFGLGTPVLPPAPLRRRRVGRVDPAIPFQRLGESAHIQLFDGEMPRFLEWPVRIIAKMIQGAPGMEGLIKWTEQRIQPIMRSDACDMSAAFFDVTAVSCAIFDVPLERAPPPPLRQEAERGGGAGTDVLASAPAGFRHGVRRCAAYQLNLYFKPARCTDVKFLREAALDRDITRPIDEDFRLLALRELVPRGIAELMTTRVSLKSYPERGPDVRQEACDGPAVREPC